MDARVIFQQMCMIFLLIIIGYAACKKGIVEVQAGKVLSTIVVNICNPALMLNSVLENDGGISHGKLLLAVGIAVGLYVCLLVLGQILPIFLGKNALERDQYALMSLFGNIGFIGIPVVSAVMGTGALIYVIICIIIFNILAYTYGISLVCRHKEGGQVKLSLRRLINMGTLASVASVFIFLFRPHVPQLLAKTVNYVGAATTLLSMMSIGISLAAMSLREIFREKRLYIYILARHILVPIALGWIMKLLSGDVKMVGTFVLISSMPVGNIPLMLCQENGVDGELLSKGIVLSTLFSLVTIPLVAYGVALC